MERRLDSYVSISDIGTWARTATASPSGSMPTIRPRRPFRSPITSPAPSGGTFTSTFMTGSSRHGLASMKPFCRPMEAAIWKAMSEESTSW